jgi:serine/threonine protein kinase
MSFANPPIETPADRLTTFFDDSQPRDAFDDPEIEEVALLLQRLEHFAQKSPRTYIVLRSIGRLEVLEQLLGEGFHDACFPVELRGLPNFLDPRIKASIVQNQRVILTKSKSTLLERGRHCHFAPEDPLPFVVLSVIGSGSYGLVQKIESRVTFKQYALKTVTRRAAFGNPNKVVMKAILNEIQVMKGLSHKHIVDYVGSYTDKRSFGIVMDPIADQDLASYMEQTSMTLDNRPTLRTFFGCLATALAFLHENHVRHRDIKPQNILVLRSNVLFTDFGLARESMDTSSGPMLVTSRYCAPEVIAAEKRNEAADMWSLGCVFLEMMAALQGHNVEWLKCYYATIDSGSTHFHTNPTATTRLLADWAVDCTESDAVPLRWIKSMLTIHRLDRSSAEQIATQATSSSMYCCDQCHDTDDADSIGSIVADFLDDLENGRDSAVQTNVKEMAVVTTRSADSSLENTGPIPATSLITGRNFTYNLTIQLTSDVLKRLTHIWARSLAPHLRFATDSQGLTPSSIIRPLEKPEPEPEYL